MKKETLEKREPYWDLVDKKAEENNSIDLDAYAKGVEDGAKYQAERMYSEEDMRKMYDISCGKIGLGRLDDQTENNQRFKDFLNEIKK